MTDDELQTILECQRSRYRFDELADDWKTWASAMLSSATIPANRYSHIRQEDAILYLCRVLRVFEDLSDGMTEDDLRGKFVSGLVASGMAPDRDGVFYFGQAFLNAKVRGLVSSEEHDWWEPGMRAGSGRVRLYQLTLAGQRLAMQEPMIEAGDDGPTAESPRNTVGQSVAQAPTASLEIVADAELGGTQGEVQDLVADVLSGQSLKLWQFLKERKHWTTFPTLADEVDCWRKPDPSDQTIDRALRRFQHDLNQIDCAPRLVIDRKAGPHRTKLDKE